MFENLFVALPIFDVLELVVYNVGGLVHDVRVVMHFGHIVDGDPGLFHLTSISNFYTLSVSFIQDQ